MKISKEVRKVSKELFQASFTNGQLDAGKVRNIATRVVAEKPRHYVDILKNYHRLIRLELDKRHAVIESATELSQETSAQVLRDLKSKYGESLTTDFRINPSLIGGLRIRVGSDVWDGSIRCRLDHLDQELATV
ncbi:MAG TPA: F0F1 ATP synthase subunit delta [Chthoniobacteraceae bacterium]|jgi:F-type H+-transporting ATPase subunit delta|nr:F0F1 ATP synthase subunit delta [Chthoniobacteraceae bacterium]